MEARARGQAPGDAENFRQAVLAAQRCSDDCSAGAGDEVFVEQSPHPLRQRVMRHGDVPHLCFALAEYCLHRSPPPGFEPAAMVGDLVWHARKSHTTRVQAARIVWALGASAAGRQLGSDAGTRRWSRTAVTLARYTEGSLAAAPLGLTGLALCLAPTYWDALALPRVAGAADSAPERLELLRLGTQRGPALVCDAVVAQMQAVSHGAAQGVYSPDQLASCAAAAAALVSEGVGLPAAAVHFARELWQAAHDAHPRRETGSAASVQLAARLMHSAVTLHRLPGASDDSSVRQVSEVARQSLAAPGARLQPLHAFAALARALRRLAEAAPDEACEQLAADLLAALLAHQRLRRACERGAAGLAQYAAALRDLAALQAAGIDFAHRPPVHGSAERAWRGGRRWALVTKFVCDHLQQIANVTADEAEWQAITAGCCEGEHGHAVADIGADQAQPSEHTGYDAMLQARHELQATAHELLQAIDRHGAGVAGEAANQGQSSCS